MNPAKSIEAVQSYLSSNSLEDFEAEHGIKGKTDGQHILLDYDMASVDWNQPYGYACRGLILCADTLNVLGLGLKKFFNALEHQADPIDWNTAKVLEKLDGTMVKRFFSPHHNDFVYTTRRQLPHEIETNRIGDTQITWRQLIDRCLQDILPQVDQQDDETLVFEVMSPVNYVVVRHDGFKGSLLARRCNRTLQEKPVYDHPTAPKVFDFNSRQEVEEFANQLKGVECEGFVVVDDNYNRVKIKGPDYVRLHHLKDNATRSVKSAILTVRHGEVDEVISYFPNLETLLRGIQEIVGDFITTHQEVYDEIKHIESQKEFAIELNSRGLEMPALLFNVRAGKAESIQQATAQLDDNKFVKYIKPLVEKAGLTSFGINDESTI